MIDALLTTSDVEPAGWALIGLIILSGLATMMIMTRAGIDLLWTPGEDAPSRLSLVEVFPIGLLLAICLGLMLWAGPVMGYLERTSSALRSEEHTSELQSLMRISYAVFCLK